MKIQLLIILNICMLFSMSASMPTAGNSIEKEEYQKILTQAKQSITLSIAFLVC